MAATEIATRKWQGTQFPAAGTWAIDATHTAVEFEAKHLMIAKVKGRFAEFEGAVTDRRRPHAVVGLGDHQGRLHRHADRAARRPSALRRLPRGREYPEITFASTGVEHDGGEDWLIPGDLTIHGVTKPVTLKTEFEGQTIDPWGGQRVAFSAETKIDREDWGLTWNQALEAGGWLVGKEIKLKIEIEAVLQA